MSSKIDHAFSRRNFIKAAAGTAAGAAVLGTAGCSETDKSTDSKAAKAPEPVDPYENAEYFYATCPPECQHHNLKACVVDGKVVKIENGNNNESMPCARGYSRVDWINSEDRLTTPLLRDGEKGENKWKEISWDEAYDLIVEKLKTAIAEHGNKSIVADAHAGNFQTLAGSAQPAFFSRIGGTTSLTGSLCCAAAHEAVPLMWGPRFYDTRETIEDADYIIVWANNPAVTMSGYFQRFLNMQNNGGKIVVIDPTFTETASKADEHIRIKPTTDTALALGMLKVIVDEDLHDKEFLKTRSTAPCLVGADGELALQDANDPLSYLVLDTKTNELKRHDEEGIDPALSVADTKFASDYTTVFDLTVAECQKWTPEEVEKETLVPADAVERIAREYAKADKSMIIDNMGGYMRIYNGTYSVASHLNLCVFTGHVGAAGNGLCDAGGIGNIVKLDPMFDNPEVPADLPKIPRANFAQHVMDDDPNPIDVFVSSRESVMTQFPNSGLVKEALKKIPFVVVIDSLMTSTALYADLVLPCAVQFELEDILCSDRGHCIQLSEKAVDPPGEAKTDFEIYKDLAERMGVGEDFNHTPEELIRKALKGTEYTYDQLKEEKSINAYPEGFIPFKDGQFETESGKAELYQSKWALGNGYKAVPTYIRATECVGGSSGLDEKYPLAAVQRKTRKTVHSTFANLDLMNNLDGNVPTIMINPKDAEARGISDGDPVIAFNDRGEHKGNALVTDHSMEGVVVLENGWTEFQGGSSSYVTNDSVGILGSEHCCNETLVDVRLNDEKTDSNSETEA